MRPVIQALIHYSQNRLPWLAYAIQRLTVAIRPRRHPADDNLITRSAVPTPCRSEGITGIGADILVVKGTWVYDSFHEGWNEIYPIKHCQRIGTWGGNWSFVGDVNAWVKGWCDVIASTTSDLTIDNQRKPENQWTIHPVIDGCKPDDDKPPVIK